jgi:hypothetical protein
MKVELNAAELDTIMTSLEYSRLNVQETKGTPYQVRQENLARVNAVAAKIVEVRR